MEPRLLAVAVAEPGISSEVFSVPLAVGWTTAFSNTQITRPLEEEAATRWDLAEYHLRGIRPSAVELRIGYGASIPPLEVA